MADTRTRDLFPQTLPENFAHILTPHLVFGDIDIRQDEHDRYCLNDLHKAAGGAEKHQPNRWLRYKGAKTLVAAFLRPYKVSETTSNKRELALIAPVRNKPLTGLFVASETTPNTAFLGGIPPVSAPAKNTPTYVIKPLVYAYAAWISPDFERYVFEVFDAVMSAAAQRQQLGFTALYNMRPPWRHIIEHPELPRAELIKLTGHKNPGSITSNRHRMREVGLGELFARGV